MSYEYLGSTVEPIQGIDWITVTHPGGEHVLGQVFDIREALDEHIPIQAEEWKFFGFEGVQLGQFSYGFRKQECIMQFRGHLATAAIAVIPASWKCTRIDLEASVMLENETTLAKKYFTSLGGSERIAKPMLRFMSTSGDGGDTLYIGSRKSLQMGRIYDKGAERRIKGDGELGSQLLWRYEVELKGEKARGAYNALWFLKGDVRPAIGQFVYDWFLSRGIVPAYDRTGVHLAIDAAVHQALEKDEFIRKLEWISRCVSPVVKKLSEQYSPFTILEALGLET